MFKRLLYEPLLHFLILGGLLFLFYSFSENKEESVDNIFVSQERITQLIEDSEKKLLKILTEEEKQELIDREVYENILYKEALKIGLDKTDIDMRRHLATKMEFVMYDTYTLPVPSDDVLKKFMLANPNDYREEQKISFTQKVLNSALNTFDESYTLSEFEASNIFGRTFAKELFSLAVDAKAQKIESDYAVHEVLISSKPTPKLQRFEKLREEIKSDYLSLQREQKNQTIYEALKLKYSINIEVK
ncbi:MAG: Unknown protein [uncultured Sulfurovum sp.]|uniref:PpiC domain-containing protein n=1 Tax=uncultured Sulfurovum sp. TaxID=269237 RepID=A0A6S6SXZ7_9BACT|nr:MAG: Unknown protein [uncultured Sulfurovum sp.]